MHCLLQAGESVLILLTIILTTVLYSVSDVSLYAVGEFMKILQSLKVMQHLFKRWGFRIL
jgi:hypothetical protein